MKTAVIGGGAAGFFLAVNLKEAVPEMAVTIFERSSRCARPIGRLSPWSSADEAAVQDV